MGRAEDFLNELNMLLEEYECKLEAVRYEQDEGINIEFEHRDPDDANSPLILELDKYIDKDTLLP